MASKNAGKLGFIFRIMIKNSKFLYYSPGPDTLTPVQQDYSGTGSNTDEGTEETGLYYGVQRVLLSSSPVQKVLR